MNRDPRTDPKSGDVIRLKQRGRHLATVRCESATPLSGISEGKSLILYSCAGKEYLCSGFDWEYSAKGAEVMVHAA